MDPNYDPLLVVLSALTSVAGSYVGLSLASRLKCMTGRRYWIWLLGAAGAVGAGAIWSMHFVAMLAFHLGPVDVSYDLGLTLLSLVIAILFTGAGMWLSVQRALIAGDADALGSGFTPDGVVNSPFNNVATAAEAAARSRAGALNYKYIHTSIEYGAPRREDEVVFMGEESYEFAPGMPQAGKTLRRRFTDLYQKVNGKWLLSRPSV